MPDCQEIQPHKHYGATNIHLSTDRVRWDQSRIAVEGDHAADLGGGDPPPDPPKGEISNSQIVTMAKKVTIILCMIPSRQLKQDGYQVHSRRSCCLLAAKWAREAGLRQTDKDDGHQCQPNRVYRLLPGEWKGVWCSRLLAPGSGSQCTWCWNANTGEPTAWHRNTKSSPRDRETRGGSPPPL